MRSRTRIFSTSGEGYVDGSALSPSLAPLASLTFHLQRARAYLVHNVSVETALHGREELGCNCFSSGESTFTECIMPRAYKSMLAYFQMVHDIPGYYETEMLVPKDEDDTSRVVNWQSVIRAVSPPAA